MVRPTLAVLPSLILEVQQLEEGAPTSTSMTTTLLLSQATFGRMPSMDKSAEPTLTIQYSDSLLCDDDTDADNADAIPDYSTTPTLLMVPRGICTFQTKAVRAQAVGAKAMIVYGTLASRYSYNRTTTDNNNAPAPTIDDIIFPIEKMDYDCANGEGQVLFNRLVFDDPIPYNPTINDAILQNSCGDNCEFCLVTGLPKQDSADSTTTVRSCCAWDLSIYLYADATQAQKNNMTITIPSAYMTMSQATKVRAGQKVILYQRWRPSWNYSSGLIWLLGVGVAALAGHLSAGEYQRKTNKLVERRERRRQARDGTTTTTRRPPSSSSARPPAAPLVPPEEVMELTAAHAAGFLVMSSTSLLILFYFKIYGVVKVFYALGCSSAVAQVIFYPLSDRFWFSHRNHVPVLYSHPEIGDVTLRDVLCYAISIALGLTWLVISFWHPDPDRVFFYWIMQDIFGACMCITFLQVIRLNNIRVASILLIVAFLYDIFFVFVTPYLFHGKSVMITVATSGGPPKADELWCEKYPNDADCQGGNPLPMLLAIPRLLDYTGGSSLLGLGDIVLPGLLLSFAARLDAAKTLIGVATGGQAQQTTTTAGLCPENRRHHRNNYFGPIVLAYAVGLAMANAAVYWMRMGQPALLYLVPCCLGTMLYIGRHELQQLWDGPRVLKAADDILYGGSSSSSSATTTSSAGHSIGGGGGEQLHAPLPVDEEDSHVAMTPPSAVDDDNDN
jgi:signal peptide peptidase-like 2B